MTPSSAADDACRAQPAKACQDWRPARLPVCPRRIVDVESALASESLAGLAVRWRTARGLGGKRVGLRRPSGTAEAGWAAGPDNKDACPEDKEKAMTYAAINGRRPGTAKSEVAGSCCLWLVAAMQKVE